MIDRVVFVIQGPCGTACHTEAERRERKVQGTQQPGLLDTWAVATSLPVVKTEVLPTDTLDFGRIA